jgi:hypothetical protein
MNGLICITMVGFLAVAASGCATDQAVARVTTVEVKTPVPVPCLTPADVPPVPQNATAAKNADVQQMAAAIGVELLQRREYDAKADVLLRSCSTIVSTTKGANP